MSIEYKDRGVVHKLVNASKLGNSKLLKAGVKPLLFAETAALFAKDAAANRFVGKEFHLKFERQPNSSGKFKTHVKLVRADAPLYRQHGVIHKLKDAGRFFEGDKPLQKKAKIKYSPKSTVGKIAYYSTAKPILAVGKYSFKAVKGTVKRTSKAALLASETAALKTAKFGFNKLRQNLESNAEMHDTGKVAVKGIATIGELNKARKYLIRYRTQRSGYKQSKQSFKGQKLKAENAKKSFKAEKQSFKNLAKRHKQKLKAVSKVYGKKQKPTKSLAAKRNQKKLLFDKKLGQPKQELKAARQLHGKTKSNFKQAKRSYTLKTLKQRKKLKTVSKVYKKHNRSKMLGERTLQKLRINNRLKTQPKINLKLQKKPVKQAKIKLKGKKKIYKAEKHTLKKRLKKSSKSVKQKSKPKKSAMAKRKQKAGFKKQPKKKLKIQKKLYKNQKHMRNSRKKQLKKKKVVPIGALPLVPVAAAGKHITASAMQKIVNTAPDNDVLQAIDKSAKAAVQTAKATKAVTSKLHEKSARTYRNHLHKQENKLKTKQQNAGKKKKKKKNSNKKSSAKEKAKQAAKKAAKAAADFAKFAFKMFGILFVPILAIIITLAIVMMMFTGTAGNSSYILGTYNAQDRYLAQAVEEYTKIAYDYNQKILKVNSSDWKNALEDLGADTSSYDTTPDDYCFGKSSKFNKKPVYDFDADKLAAFMCAYTYDFGDDSDDVPNWTWDDSYKDVLQKLFDTEYKFEHKYEDFSGWKTLDSYVFYGGGGSGKSYYTVYSEDFSKSKMKIRGVPSEISQFCKDDYLHYDYDTLEVLDANNDDERTGYFIQDQRYIIKDSSGSSNNPFYGARTDGKYVWEHGTNKDGSTKYELRSDWHWTSDNTQIYCVVNPTDAHKWNSTLDEVCLISFYQKNYWYENCDLYYTVTQKCSFDEACRKVLSEKEKGSADAEKYKESRTEFYKLLTTSQKGEDGKYKAMTYGNHQMLNAPVGGKSLQTLSKKIYNGYGYDIQAWNSEHCSITDSHKGIDFEASKGSNVYAMFDGYVNWIDESNHSLSLLTSENLEFWYEETNDNEDRKYALEAIYVNIKTTVKKGDTVKQGDIIGKVTNDKCCWKNQSNPKAGKIYLHITLKINYSQTWGVEDWTEVDPRYLIYRHDGDGKAS